MIVTLRCTRKGCKYKRREHDFLTEVGHQADDGSYHPLEKENEK